MMLIGQAAAKLHPRLALRGCALLCILALSAAAQTSPDPPARPAGSSENASAQAGFRGILNLDGPWRFHSGDDPRWAAPDLDDSSWPLVVLGQPLSDQIVDPYTRYGWYRLRLDARQLAAVGDASSGGPLELLIASHALCQFSVWIDGVEAGSTRGMASRPAMYRSPPFAVRLSAPGTGGARVIAIRAWAGPEALVHQGLLEKVELGAHHDIEERLSLAEAQRWNQSALAPILVAFLFLCVAGLGLALYMAQRDHREYIWLALLCLAVGAELVAEAAFGLGAVSLGVYRVLASFSGSLFAAITLEFVLRFAASKRRRLVRVVQAGMMLRAFAALLGVHLVNDILTVATAIVFYALVCVLLYEGWRRGREEAGVMLAPFFLAAVADSANTVLDFAVRRNSLPARFAYHHFYLGPVAFSTGTVAYAIFLGSLAAVILHRFIGISRDEQRSAAEVAAARSVQALLIPTELPSNHNFMLESAYLPANGVGGDFFQVLPLQDESLLIVIGDVTGKGLQAAMNSSSLVGALRNELAHDPATILNHLNRVLLGAVAAPGKAPGLDAAPCFATCLCARVYAHGAITIANAGHLNPYRDGRELETEPSLPLGVLANANYTQATFQLERGDRIVFLSDGVVEATNAQNELFGFDRTRQVSNESARYIAQTAQRFGQTDDITVVSLYIASPSAPDTSQE